jgi:magnesium transporter
MRYLAVLQDDDGLHRLEDEASIAAAFHAGRGLLWLHYIHTDEPDTLFLERELGLHPLAVEDCLNTRYQRPKIDDYGEYLFLTLHGVDYARTSQTVSTGELDLFIGPSWVITSTQDSVSSVLEIAGNLDRFPRPMQRGASMLAHAIVDALVDSVLPAVDRMHEVTDAIEEDALTRPDRETLGHIQRLKHSAQRLHRVTVPQRDLIFRISRGDYALLADSAALFFRDVYDHLVRIEDLVSALRERADNALTTYLSSVNIRQNETMRIVSIVAAIFLPLTLITGIYGMNFEHMPELEHAWAYPTVLGLLALIGVSITLALFVRPWWRERRRGGQIPSFAIAPHILQEALSEATRLRHRVLEAAHLERRERD